MFGPFLNEGSHARADSGNNIRPYPPRGGLTMPLTPEQIAAREGKLTAFPARLVGALDDGEPALPRFQAIHHADPIESRPGFVASQGADGRGAGTPKRRYCSRPRPRYAPLPRTPFQGHERPLIFRWSCSG